MKEYPIKFIELVENLALEILEYSKAHHLTLMVTDDTVYREYKSMFHRLESQGLLVSVIPSGESSKSASVLFNLLSQIAKCGLTRKDLLIAIGGGVVGDLTGFAASIYMRGIKWLSVPTTLLAQVDSSVGGKTAINLPEGKNMVGSFYNPIGVFICPQFTKTLRSEEFLSGVGELIKYAYLADYGMLKDIEALVQNGSLNTNEQATRLTMLIQRAIEIKSEVVLKDFKEEHERKYLNLGHSFGHAIEALDNFKMPHGICVAQGIWWILALELLEVSEDMQIDVKEELETYERLIERLGIPKPRYYNPEELLQFILRDKKMNGKFIDLVRISLINQDDLAENQNRDILECINKQCRIETMDTELLLTKIEYISYKKLRRAI